MNRRTTRKGAKASNIVLIALGTFLVVFVIAMTAIFCVKGETPDTLIQCVMGGSGFEATLLAGIKISKVLSGSKSQESAENAPDS